MTENAERIADILCDTSHEDRGDLLIQVAGLLRDRSQFFTASLIERVGETYNNGE